MQRRKFLRLGMTGVAALSLAPLVGCGGGPSVTDGNCGDPGDDNGGGGNGGGGDDAVSVQLSIEEALFEMVDGTFVYHWAFQDRGASAASLPRLPGPVLTLASGRKVQITVANNLDEEHGFSILGLPETGTVIPPGESRTVTFTAPPAGTYLYHDHLNSPVNRVLGLHGAMVVLPAEGGNTPYSHPTSAVQRLFDDLGNTGHFPPHASYLSLANRGWQRDRNIVWLQSQVDPRFNERAMNGLPIDPTDMAETFLPRYFLMNGRSGVFSAHDPASNLTGRIGQPLMVRILNAGLFTHSDHLHANHVYVTAVNNVVRENVFCIDSFSIYPLDTVDWLVPFIRPPDIAGDPATPLRELLRNELALTIAGPNGSPGVPQSPLVYPMHCHNEPSQTAAGGNYPQGIVIHFTFLGDVDGIDFPNAEMHETNTVLGPDDGHIHNP